MMAPPRVSLAGENHAQSAPTLERVQVPGNRFLEVLPGVVQAPLVHGDEAQIELDRRVGRIDEENTLEPTTRLTPQLA